MTAEARGERGWLCRWRVEQMVRAAVLFVQECRSYHSLCIDV